MKACTARWTSCGRRRAAGRSIYPEIQYMPPEEQEKARKNLLAYCRLDTLAMVKVWEELKRAAGE